MIEKIKELRKQIPIPIGEASRLLKENNDDLEICIRLFKAHSIKLICEQTNCDEELATQQYEANELDFNRTVSSIREIFFDQDYTPIENVTIGNIKKIHRWLDIIDDKDFITALDYQSLDDVILALSSISNMRDIAQTIEKAKRIKDYHFEGYSDNDSMEEFIRRNRLLDDNAEIQEINKSIPVKITLIDKELSRHLRNLYKREAVPKVHHYDDEGRGRNNL